MGKRLGGIFGKLERRIADACEKAIAAGEIQKCKQLFIFARKCDEVMEASTGDAKLGASIAELIANSKLSTAEKMLGQESGMNPIEIKNCLIIVKAIWAEIDKQD